jgi:hypothetical protein
MSVVIETKLTLIELNFPGIIQVTLIGSRNPPKYHQALFVLSHRKVMSLWETFT